MGAKSRRKGAEGEREVVRLFSERGYRAIRVSPLEAGGGRVGDVYVAELGWIQVKRGAHVPAAIGRWLAGADLLLTRRDREEWVVSLPLERFLELCRVRPPDAPTAGPDE